MGAPAASGQPRPGSDRSESSASRSPRSAPGSPASCTTRPATRSTRSSSRRAPPRGFGGEIRSGRGGRAGRSRRVRDRPGGVDQRRPPRDRQRGADDRATRRRDRAQRRQPGRRRVRDPSGRRAGDRRNARAGLVGGRLAGRRARRRPVPGPRRASVRSQAVNATVRVMLVDDDELMRKGLRAVLSSDQSIEVVEEADDGRIAIQRARHARPEVVLMDVRMPEMDGIAATAELIDAVPEAKVVILTTFEEDEYILGALRAGASGFLLKRTSPEQLIAAIHTVAAGEALLSPSVTRRVIDRTARQTIRDSTSSPRASARSWS